MFQLVDVLLSVQTPPVPGNTLPLKIDGDRFGTGFDGYLPSAVSGRNGVVIRIETNSTEPVHPAGDTLTGVKGIPGQRIQLLPLLGEHLTHRGFFAANLVGQVVQTLFLEHSVQIFHGFRFGNRNADIAANITH